jgi:hypothetical protein
MVLRSVLLVPIFFQLFGAASFAQEARRSSESARAHIHPGLQNIAQDEPTEVLVLYRDEQTSRPSGLGRQLASRHNVNLSAHFEQAGSSFGQLTRAQIEELATDPDVAFIAPNEKLQALELDKGPESVGAYAAPAIGCPRSGAAVARLRPATARKKAS